MTGVYKERELGSYSVQSTLLIFVGNKYLLYVVTTLHRRFVLVMTKPRLRASSQVLQWINV